MSCFELIQVNSKGGWQVKITLLKTMFDIFLGNNALKITFPNWHSISLHFCVKHFQLQYTHYVRHVSQRYFNVTHIWSKQAMNELDYFSLFFFHKFHLLDKAWSLIMCIFILILSMTLRQYCFNVRSSTLDGYFKIAVLISGTKLVYLRRPLR